MYLLISFLTAIARSYKYIYFDCMEVSSNIPATFFFFNVRSFGHFSVVLIPNTFSIALCNASEVAIGTSVICEVLNFG